MFVPAALASSVSQTNRPAPPQAREQTRTMMPGAAAVQLKQDMRKLWTDHVVWTRDYIIAAVGDQPDAQKQADGWHHNAAQIADFLSKANPTGRARRSLT